MNILITICARGGSKGVKNKNIRELNGKPLISYTIEVAKKWGKAKRIICSTDSEKIAKIAKKYGAEIPFMRPKEIAKDDTGKIEAIRHALVNSEKIFSEKYELVVDLDATSPIRTKKDLDNCLKIFNEKRPEVLFSVVKSKKNPYFNMVERNDKGFAELSKNPEKPLLSRQESPQVFDMNASIYFYNREFLLDKKNISPFSSNRVMIYEMDDKSRIDIDDEMDFRYIEFLIKNKVVPL